MDRSILLRSWRKLDRTRTQEWLGGELIPPVTGGTISQWETSPREFRPAIGYAVQIETITNGDVPATNWGYPQSEVDYLKKLSVGHTANVGPPDKPLPTNESKP